MSNRRVDSKNPCIAKDDKVVIQLIREVTITVTM